MKKVLPVLIVVFWLATVCVGSAVLWIYDFTPGPTVSAPTRWPSQSKFPHVVGQPTLVMFAHPNCPCPRASMGELAILMSHCPSKVTASVVFLESHENGNNRPHSDLWRSAEAIPGALVRTDENGHEAAWFHATTSGHVVLYDAGGKLLFRGGITSARGHAGDNAGRSAITQWLQHESPASKETPVFGCSLSAPPISENKCAVCPR